jgi:hypothetical protein
MKKAFQFKFYHFYEHVETQIVYILGVSFCVFTNRKKEILVHSIQIKNVFLVSQRSQIFIIKIHYRPIDNIFTSYSRQ